jgi:hypothetical protein
VTADGTHRNAKLYGMEKSIHITDAQYNVGLSIFFVSYALFEVHRVFSVASDLMY